MTHYTLTEDFRIVPVPKGSGKGGCKGKKSCSCGGARIMTLNQKLEAALKLKKDGAGKKTKTTKTKKPKSAAQKRNALKMKKRGEHIKKVMKKYKVPLGKASKMVAAAIKDGVIKL